MTRSEPRWLGRLVVDAAHHLTIRSDGGMPGLRDENALESALARPRHRWTYEPEVTIPQLAASYGYGLVMNHPYVDGNKRVGLIAVVTFLNRHGHRLVASEGEALRMILRLAAGDVAQAVLDEWVGRLSERVG